MTPEEEAIRRREGRAAPNLQLAIANVPDVARLQLELLRAITAGLDLRRRELAILAHARLVGNAYCWGHHVPPALSAGFTEDQLRRLRAGDPSTFDPADRDIVAFVQAFELGDVTDGQWTILGQQFTEEELIRLTMLVGCYAMISRVQAVLDVPQDVGFGGFDVP